VAHQIVDGQRIAIHNDFLGGEETHRLVLQLNRGWSENEGGMMMLFSDPGPESVCQILRPLSRSAVGFEIGPNSYHAVSRVSCAVRYTLVYSFYSS
jgi:Rps23 Pro-64 3,4-dihydroxylase Tpa1-like proline 4-hydroxylase